MWEFIKEGLRRLFGQRSHDGLINCDDEIDIYNDFGGVKKIRPLNRIFMKYACDDCEWVSWVGEYPNCVTFANTIKEATERTMEKFIKDKLEVVREFGYTSLNLLTPNAKNKLKEAEHYVDRSML